MCHAVLCALMPSRQMNVVESIDSTDPRIAGRYVPDVPPSTSLCRHRNGVSSPEYDRLGFYIARQYSIMLRNL